MVLLADRVTRVLPIIAVLAAAAVGGAIWQWTGEFQPFIDFTKAYYPAGAAVLAGDLDGLRLLLRSSAFVNLPILAPLFAPLALYPEDDAILFFTALGFLAALAGWWLLARVLDMNARQAAWLLALFLVNGPLVYSLKLGNTSHFVLLLIVLGLAAVKSGRGILAGSVFALAAVVKPMLLLGGAYFVLTARWPKVIGGATALVGTAAASVAIFGADVHREWIESSILPFFGHPMPAFNNQSLDAFLVRLDTSPKPDLGWSLVDPTPAFAAWRSLLAGIFVIGAASAIASSHFSRSSPAAELALVVATAVILSPVSWSHYHCLLLVPWAVLLMSPRSTACNLMLAAAIGLGSLPATIFGWQEAYWRNLTSAYFFAAVLTWAALIVAMQPAQALRVLLSKTIRLRP